MALLMTHFYPQGTKEQYLVVLNAVHPTGELPPGQFSSAAGPTEGGWLISSIWESQDAYDSFVRDTLMPVLAEVTGGFNSAPEERLAECVVYQTA